MYLVISGNIATGKTTLCDGIAHMLGVRPLVEPYEENPYLSRFFRNPSRWALPFELFFLLKRAESLAGLNDESVIGDRAIQEDVAVFARDLNSEGVLVDSDWELYNLASTMVTQQARDPDLFVYLHAPVSDLWRRIEERKRPFEIGAGFSYLQRIEGRYRQWRTTLDPSRVVDVDASRIDFRTEVGLGRVLDIIRNNPVGADVLRRAIDGG